MITDTDVNWSARADVGQRSFDHFFGTSEPQLFNNTYPGDATENVTFNYWWIAHIIDVRLDAYLRSGEAGWLHAADVAYRNILTRNGGLFNDYFDDMLWYALAILRLFEATGTSSYLDDARAIWKHVVQYGWNEEFGASVAWRKQQLHYKNTPANGPFVILSCRLSRIDRDPRYLELALGAFDWLTNNLVHEESGFVEDGVNRENDGRVDTQWRFTYNQGLYVGAAVELSLTTRGENKYLQRAARTALTAITELGSGGLFRDEGDGGDEGLFKGIYYRYVGQLLPLLDKDSPATATLVDFVRTSTNALWDNCLDDNGYLLASNDWSQKPSEKVAYSSQLSAIIALELRAQIEASLLPR